MNGDSIKQLVLKSFQDGQCFDVHSVAELIRFAAKKEPDKNALREILRDMAVCNVIVIVRYGGNGDDSTYCVRPAINVSR